MPSWAALGFLAMVGLIPFDRLAPHLGVCLIYAIIACIFWQIAMLAKNGTYDPFDSRNIQRLAVTAWLALAWQACEISLAFSGENVNLVSVPGLRLRTVEENTVSISGLMLVIMLFVLVHIFRQGTAMREDLEGTV